MKFSRVVLSAFVAAVTRAAKQTPIGRVVDLLKEIEETAEKEGKNEEKLYYQFVCWGTTVVDTKSASNEVAKSRISELETYIEDISSGAIEFTTERVDLEKELGDINAAIESATALRKKEKQEFESAEDELKKAKVAVEKAIIVLKEATAKEGGSAAFVQAQTALTYSLRKEESEALMRATELGSRVLSAGDALFLKRLLAGDVPKADWKKLNRKASFKDSYKSRSGKIQDLLADLQKTIATNLVDAQANEKKTQQTFDDLMTAKESEKSRCEEALNSMEAENGARDAAKQESQDEVDSLKEQVSNDEKYIKQTKMQLADMKQSYKDRYELRNMEIAAINKAIEILTSDAARDNQKKSYASQGYLFLQVESDESAGRRMVLAASAVLKKSDVTGRLAALAGYVALNKGSHFTEVLEAIDKMVTVLKEEEASDLETKETCEKDRAEATREAALKSRGMDELTEANNKLSAQIDEIKAQIVEKNNAIAATEKELAEATQNRERENIDWKSNEKSDKLNLETVGSAKEVLTSFYKDNGLMFVQKSVSHMKQPAGEAPPPPPATWDAPYGGKTDQATSILAILDMIMEDVQKDIDKAKAAEEKAQADFETFKSESETSIQTLNEEVTALEGTQAEKEEKTTQNVKDRSAMHEELNAVMKLIADAKPGCDFFTINYPSRVKNRHIEIDGLDKAKTILSGGSFNAAPDPNREMSVGDAFLARRQ